MLVQAAGQGNQTWLGNVTDVRGGLPRFEALHDHGGLNGAESIDHDLALDRLHWVDDDTNSSVVQILPRLLGLHICAGEPAAETWMRVIPSDADLVSSDLLHHFHNCRLVNVIDGLYTDGGTTLRHGQHINDLNCVVIVDLSDHEAHDLEGNTRSGMLKHFQESQRGDVDLLTRVWQRHITARCLSLTHTAHSGLS